MQLQRVYVATAFLVLVVLAAACVGELEADSSLDSDTDLAEHFAKRHMFLAKRHLLIAKRRAGASHHAGVYRYDTTS